MLGRTAVLRSSLATAAGDVMARMTSFPVGVWWIWRDCRSSSATERRRRDDDDDDDDDDDSDADDDDDDESDADRDELTDGDDLMQVSSC